MPVVGPLLGAMMAGLVALTSGQGLARLVAIVALFIVVKLVDDTVIQPLTIGRSVHLHPVLLISSVVAGGQALGVLGMVIAVPVATVLQETIRLWLEHRRALAGYFHPRGSDRTELLRLLTCPGPAGPAAPPRYRSCYCLFLRPVSRGAGTGPIRRSASQETHGGCGRDSRAE